MEEQPERIIPKSYTKILKEIKEKIRSSQLKGADCCKSGADQTVQGDRPNNFGKARRRRRRSGIEDHKKIG